MDEQQARALLKKYTDGTATLQEIQQVESYYFRYLKKKHNLPGQKRLVDDQAAIRIALQRHIDNDEPVELPRTRTVWPRIAAAASVALLLSAGGYFILHQKHPVSQTAQNQIHDIAPGGNKAILTLASGKKILLTGAGNGVLALQAGTQVNKKADGIVQYAAAENNTAEAVYNTLTTPRKGRYELVLADGSEVTLDAASSITYPVAFNGKERRVAVTGQVYFKVRHDAAHPFLVTFNGKTVEDIGTEFNINAYSDEPNVKVTLVSGSIKVNEQTLAEAGQQAVLTNDHLKLRTVDPESVTAWKNNYFYFEGSNLEEVLRQVSRWYDVDIVYENNAVKNASLTGTVSRYKTVNSVLRKLAYTSGAHFRLDGNKIIVTN